MKRYISKKVICPYYLHESRQVINCSGVADNTVLHLAFANAGKWQDYKQNICCSNFAKCPIYRMLEVLKTEEKNRK